MSVFTATVLVSRADGIDASFVLTCAVPGSNGLSSETATYCFNLPESLPRLANSHGVALKDVAAVFLPALSYRNLGGFPSLCLSSRARQFLEKLMFVGPKGLDRVIDGFVALGTRALVSARVTELFPDYTGNCFEDRSVAVCGLCSGSKFAGPPSWLVPPMGTIDLVSDSDDDMAPTKGHKRKVEDVIDLTSDLDETTTLNACNAASERARERSRKVGTMGSWPSQANRGGGLTNAGRAVPERGGRILCFVVLLKATGELLVVVALPDAAALEELTRHPLWGYVRFPYKAITAVLHMSALELMATEAYRNWAASLPGERVFVDGTLGEGLGLDVGLHRVLERGVRLSAAAEKHFLLPFSYSQPTKPYGTVFPNGVVPPGAVVASLLTEVSYAAPGSALKIRPSPVQPTCPSALVSDTLRLSSRLREMNRLNALRRLNDENPWRTYLPLFSSGRLSEAFIRDVVQSDAWPYIYAQAQSLAAHGAMPPCLLSMAAESEPSSLLFLGTGCAEPSAWRGGSAILLRIGPEQRGLLIDCGEGTYGQMVRYMGISGARKAVDALECVWISHRHADHCAGLAALLSERSPQLPPVTVFSPRRVATHAQSASVPCDCYSNNAMEHGARAKRALGVREWTSFAVEHGIEAYGLRVTLHNGFSLVYSGDTEPCASVEREAVDCTLLIHESTHACSDHVHATKTKHSTWGQALQIGRRTRAYRTILTHFSRRYPGLPNGLTARELGERAAVAFDGMLVKLTDIVFLPFFNAAVEEALTEIEFGADLVESEDEEVIELLSDASDEEPPDGPIAKRLKTNALDDVAFKRT